MPQKRSVRECSGDPIDLYDYTSLLRSRAVRASHEAPSLKDRIAELTAIRDQAQLDAERTAASVERLGPTITPESLRRFALAARRKLRNKDGTYRRDHLRALAQRVEVVDQTQIRIMGAKTELLRTLVTGVSVESAALGVRSFVPKWRAGVDKGENWIAALTWGPRQVENLRPPA